MASSPALWKKNNNLCSIFEVNPNRAPASESRIQKGDRLVSINEHYVDKHLTGDAAKKFVKSFMKDNTVLDIVVARVTIVFFLTIQ